jgi:hypothetical protein
MKRKKLAIDWQPGAVRVQTKKHKPRTYNKKHVAWEPGKQSDHGIDKRTPVEWAQAQQEITEAQARRVLPMHSATCYPQKTINEGCIPGKAWETTEELFLFKRPNLHMCIMHNFSCSGETLAGPFPKGTLITYLSEATIEYRQASLNSYYSDKFDKRIVSVRHVFLSPLGTPCIVDDFRLVKPFKER